jgi:cob(I)alamin adenosyltransferase
MAVKLTRIYTRGGDRGETSLTDGSRVRKDDPRVAAYGAVDEANATVGLARLDAPKSVDSMLARIQNDLFDLGADLSTPFGPSKRQANALRIVPAQVTRLEGEIDKLNAALKPLNSFVLPGGSPCAAHLHLARTVTRRAERLAVSLAAKAEVNPEAIKYLNRLSDLLFVMARYVNGKGKADILWVPGASR